MVRRVVIGDLRVQRIDRRSGRRSWTIVWPEGTVHEEADRFLRVHDGSGTQKTYAYYLVDHLRWLERECLALGNVRLRDLERYMGVVGAEVHMPLGEPWRAGKRPTARAIDGLEKALAGLGLLDQALALDLRKPQDYFHRVWSIAFRAADLAGHADDADKEDCV
jgi:hypothetical protein